MGHLKNILRERSYRDYFTKTEKWDPLHFLTI